MSHIGPTRPARSAMEFFRQDMTRMRTYVHISDDELQTLWDGLPAAHRDLYLEAEASEVARSERQTASAAHSLELLSDPARVARLYAGVQLEAMRSDEVTLRSLGLWEERHLGEEDMEREDEHPRWTHDPFVDTRDPFDGELGEDGMEEEDSEDPFEELQAGQGDYFSGNQRDPFAEMLLATGDVFEGEVGEEGMDEDEIEDPFDESEVSGPGVGDYFADDPSAEGNWDGRLRLRRERGVGKAEDEPDSKRIRHA